MAVASKEILTHTLILEGHVPSKKNCNRPSKRGGFYRDEAVAAYITGLEFQASCMWNGKPELTKIVGIRATFYVRDGRADLDNKYTTLQDVLVSARVIKNDSIAHIARFSCSAFIDSAECVVVEIDAVEAVA